METRKCINSELKCNGYVDCPLDFSDEMNCFNGMLDNLAISFLCSIPYRTHSMGSRTSRIFIAIKKIRTL